ncbi:MAG: lysophospholipid acyltransferase family protein [Bacteroidota bacterium]|nr:lysophospholipid acyltransferase family protein [Bacteroidota bacterium]
MQLFPELGPLVPSRKTPKVRAFCRRLLAAAGWGIEGSLPNRSKFVIIAAPHTSNWDFCVAMLVIGALELRVTWLAKHTIFRWPLGLLMRRLGGLPVERTRHHGVVDHAVTLYRRREQLILAITPEGTRGHVTRWKTGFYHIATGAGVPVVPAYLDYRRKRVGFGPMVWPNPDMDTAIRSLQAFYAPYARRARHPELFGTGKAADSASR